MQLNKKRYRPNKVLYVKDFTHINWDRDLEHRISTTSYVFNLFGEAMS